MKASTPILFLDIDGVLIAYPEGDYAAYQFTAACVSVLREILDLCPTLRIVFSTTWRLAPNVHRLHAQWLEHGLDPNLCIDGTPDLRPAEGRPVLPHLRGREIEAWLRAHPRIEHWIALDDDRVGIEPILGSARAVFTDPRTGLTRGDAARVRHLLGPGSDGS